MRRHAAGRSSEYVDHGVSGSQDHRKALDALVGDVRRRRVDVVACWRLDRLGRGLRHLVALLDEFHSLGVAFVSLNEGIDCTTPAGRLQLHILAALAEFERARIAERVRAGLARARGQWHTAGPAEVCRPHREACSRSPSANEAGSSSAARVALNAQAMAEGAVTPVDVVCLVMFAAVALFFWALAQE